MPRKLKLIYRKRFIAKAGICGSKSNCVDERRAYYNAIEEGVAVRPARNPQHLPDSWTDTKFIKRIKSWKHQVKQPKPWGSRDRLDDVVLFDEYKALVRKP